MSHVLFESNFTNETDNHVKSNALLLPVHRFNVGTFW